MSISKFQTFLTKFTHHNFKTLNLIKISQKNILDNFDYFQSLNPDCQIWPVLKSNSYGHGLAQITKILKQRKFEYLIADSYYEALKIHSISPRQKVLLIGSTHPDNFQFLKLKNTTFCIQDFYSLQKLANLNKKVTIHLKINTGMNRQGIEINQIKKYLELISKNPNINLEGIFSHLADADNSDNKFTDFQNIQFNKVIRIFEKNNFKLKFIHLAATAGTNKINNPKINAIRLGIGLYGINPLNPKDKNYNKLQKLKPALSFQSTIIKTRILDKNNPVSYNLTYQAKTKINTAILPVGYNEGLNRELSNLGFIKYQNNFYQIIGRICMNLTIINLENKKAKLFDQVEIISNNPADKNSIQNIAKLANTIPYVILVNLHPSIRRIIV